MKVLYIGNRPKVLSVLVNKAEIELVKALVIEQPLINDIDGIEVVRVLRNSERERVVKEIVNSEYDLLVSAGCSYVLPISTFPLGRSYINCHPSDLPFGRGMHPLNECFLSGRELAGVSVHYLTDELDAGDIIRQVRFPVTDEVDVAILYGFIFDLEAELLSQVVDDFLLGQPAASPQVGLGTYYSRPKSERVFSLVDPVDHFLRHVRGFSAIHLGTLLNLNGRFVRVFMAQKINNSFILSRYERHSEGIIFEQEAVVLVKFRESLVRLDRYKFID